MWRGELFCNVINNATRNMSLSYLTESEAPRDFRVSSTESDGHYKKCTLCYTGKKNFYCTECVKNGSFVHSSMPYSDRFVDKQMKFMRVKINRQHVLDRCEKLLATKLKKDVLLTETKQSRDNLHLLQLAIEQRKSIIDSKKKELKDLRQHNDELRQKLPRYQKRVTSLGKHAQTQRLELQNKVSFYNDQTQVLAALRRSRIRQLNRYIFPVYISYDSSDSIEDMEFVGSDEVEEPPSQPQLHIVAPWLPTDGDCEHVQAWVSANKECAATGDPATNPAHRVTAAMGLAAQLLALLAWILDVRLPYAISLSDYTEWRAWRGGARRLRAGCAALCARAGLAPPAPAPAPAPPAALAGLHALAVAAAADDPLLGRVEAWAVWSAWAALAGEPEDEPEPPEHLHWPETAEMEEAGCAPGAASAPAPAPAPAASLVTSAAASLASMWRGWTK